MTLYDLISELEDLRDEHGDDILVVASCDYGDIGHTEQLIEITMVETVNPQSSAYSKSGWCYPDNVDDEKVDQENEVIVLRGV